jgi:Uma2 family endonuclease
MATSLAKQPKSWTAADLALHFGPIPIERIRTNPTPGQATEEDVLAIFNREKRLCELVDGVLVEKTVGYLDSYLALEIGAILRDFAKKKGLGVVLGADSMARLSRGLVRIPDVSFVPWEPDSPRNVTDKPMLTKAPALAVEVLSPSNTRQEMERKLRDYFEAGVRLVWYLDPRRRMVTVYRSVEDWFVVDEEHSLDGGDVLPGFRLALKELFAEVEKPDDKATKKGPHKNGGARRRKKPSAD